MAVTARQVLFELPPGMSAPSDCPGGGSEDGGRVLRDIVRCLAAWLTDSGACSVRFEPWPDADDDLPGDGVPRIGVCFKLGKREGTRFGRRFLNMDDMVHCMRPFCARHQLKCSGGSASGGVLIESMV